MVVLKTAWEMGERGCHQFLFNIMEYLILL